MGPKRWPLVIAANTLPVRRARGGKQWQRSPGGLVSALAPIVRESGGAWVGWPGTAGPAPDPFTHDGIANIPIGLSAGEVRGSYQGVCNRTLWPLYHDVVRPPEFHRHWWRRYVDVNERFAARVAEIATPKATVWIHDYHLQLMPAILRTLRNDVRIGFFLHIPFPAEGLFARIPWRRQIVQGMLGADVVGFQTPVAAQNFVRLAPTHSTARRRGKQLQVDDRTVRVDAFPISIDVDRFETVARDPAVAKRSAELRRRLGQGRRIILGVDRLDYTKGIDLRLKAYGEYLAQHHTTRDSVFVQVAVPSRVRISEYKDLRSTVEELVGHINGEYGEVGIAAVHYVRRNLPFDELIALYRAADVMLVTPLVDGMNLVAKEYVATRIDDTGVLVLSEFTGAAAELKSALLVNPHDVDGITEAVDRALNLPPRERTRRMRNLRQQVQHHTVHDWARTFLDTVRDPTRSTG